MKADKVTAGFLTAVYSDNEVAGDQVFKDKWLLVSGVVDHVGRDITGKAYIVLKNDDRRDFRRVQCFFSASDHKLAALFSGYEVSIRGKCRGLMMNAMLDDCEVVSSSPPPRRW